MRADLVVDPHTAPFGLLLTEYGDLRDLLPDIARPGGYRDHLVASAHPGARCPVQFLRSPCSRYEPDRTGCRIPRSAARARRRHYSARNLAHLRRSGPASRGGRHCPEVARRSALLAQLPVTDSLTRHSYDPLLPAVLHGVSFTAKAGERIGSESMSEARSAHGADVKFPAFFSAVVGRTGSGKVS